MTAESEAVSEKKIGSFAVPQLVMVCVMYLYLPQVAWAVPVVTVNTLQQPRACISLPMFDTHPRTRAYVPVILVSSKGLSDGWTDGTEHLVTITLHHSLRGQTQPRKPESNRVGLILTAHFGSIEFVFTGAPGFSLRFLSTFKQHY